MAFFFYAYFKDDAAENVRSGGTRDFFVKINLCKKKGIMHVDVALLAKKAFGSFAVLIDCFQ